MALWSVWTGFHSPQSRDISCRIKRHGKYRFFNSSCVCVCFVPPLSCTCACVASGWATPCVRGCAAGRAGCPVGRGWSCSRWALWAASPAPGSCRACCVCGGARDEKRKANNDEAKTNIIIISPANPSIKTVRRCSLERCKSYQLDAASQRLDTSAWVYSRN